MAARKCPLCLAKVPAGHTVAYTDGMDCPGCGERLEVTALSRGLATTAGLLAGVLVWRLTGVSPGTFGQLLPIVYSIVAFGIVSPLALMMIADLRVRTDEPPAAVEEAPHGHGGHH